MSMPEQSREEPGGSGHPAVDAAVGPLSEVASFSPREQVAAYEAAHRALQETLSTIEER
jgi:hypothetical protein